MYPPLKVYPPPHMLIHLFHYLHGMGHKARQRERGRERAQARQELDAYTDECVHKRIGKTRSNVSTFFTLLLEDEALVHVVPDLWPLPLLSSLTNKVDDSSEKLGSDILPSHVAL